MLQQDEENDGAIMEEDDEMSDVLLQNEQILFPQATEVSPQIFSSSAENPTVEHSHSRRRSKYSAC